MDASIANGHLNMVAYVIDNILDGVDIMGGNKDQLLTLKNLPHVALSLFGEIFTFSGLFLNLPFSPFLQSRNMFR